MKKNLLHTPEGVRDIYNNECKNKYVASTVLRGVLQNHGYELIQTPTIEFFDVFNKERGCVPSNEMYKLFDRYGNTLVLRPDITPSIARIASKYFADTDVPVRLYYEGNTFINNSKYYQGKLNECTIIGGELIGDDSVEADYEILHMIDKSMANSMFTDYQIEVGNVAFFKGLLEEAGIAGEDEEELVTLILEKNYLGVESLLNSLNIREDITKVLLELPQLFGSVEVLDKARALTDNKACHEALDRLYKLYDYAQLQQDSMLKEHLSFDLGAISKHSYYTGILVYAYTYGTGEPIIAGGRYDKLLGQFGIDKPAIGYSINVDTLMLALARQNINQHDRYNIIKNKALLVCDDAHSRLSAMFNDFVHVPYRNYSSDGATLGVDKLCEVAVKSNCSYVCLVDAAASSISCYHIDGTKAEYDEVVKNCSVERL